MFYLTPEGWKLFQKKISYKEEKEVYEDQTDFYENNPKFSEIVIEDLALSSEELRRFETIRHITSMAEEDVANYVFSETIDKPELVEMATEVKAEQTRQRFAKMIRWDALTTEEMLDLVDDFKNYEIGSYYIPGDIFNYSGQLYQVLPNATNTGHTALANWIPNQTPSLYLPIAPPGVIAEWKQPTGKHDAYRTGIQVIFEGQIYESLDDYNAHSPAAYAAGWKLIVEEETPTDPPEEPVEEVIPDWVQPYGGSGTYVLGAKVMFEGQAYENIFTNDTYNVWSPTGYPQGWKLIV